LFPISIDPSQLRDLINGSKAIHQALGGRKTILADEKKTSKFAYSCVVAVRDIKKGNKITKDDIWVKRPGTGKILAEFYYDIINKKAKFNIKKDSQVEWKMFE